MKIYKQWPIESPFNCYKTCGYNQKLIRFNARTLFFSLFPFNTQQYTISIWRMRRRRLCRGRLPAIQIEWIFTHLFHFSKNCLLSNKSDRWFNSIRLIRTEKATNCMVSLLKHAWNSFNAHFSWIVFFFVLFILIFLFVLHWNQANYILQKSFRQQLLATMFCSHQP